MISSFGQQEKLPASSASLEMDTTSTTVPLDLRDLPLIWYSLTREQRLHLLKHYPESAAIVDPLHWMCDGWTRTKDEQDQFEPYKPMPMRPYLRVLADLWRQEPVLFIEKSRSMMISWATTGLATHHIMTRQPSKAVFWAQDQDRAVILRDYAWTLWEQQDERLKSLYPVVRPRERQAFDRLEFALGGSIVALPGKDPNKIRGEHPSILLIDEAAFIENGAEAFDVALSSRVQKVIVISSQAPSWFYRVTKTALECKAS
jgi:hypothetical protein